MTASKQDLKDRVWNVIDLAVRTADERGDDIYVEEIRACVSALEEIEGSGTLSHSTMNEVNEVYSGLNSGE
jgi:hypothetical protein